MKKDIGEVCDDCGIEANRLTCLKKFGAEPLKAKFDVSTYHIGVCDWCGVKKMVTEVRDFFYPDFSLMKKVVCPNIKNHTPHPEGYSAHHEWMATKSKTHKQIKCPGCGLWAIWIPKERKK